MREIKFRFWDKNRNRWSTEPMVNWDGLLLRYGIFETLDDVSEDFVACQFTGLRDTRGIEIYEGHLITADDLDGNLPVEWSDSLMRYSAGLLDLLTVVQYPNARVVGDIYKTPELLKN